uniref:Uncharacterized protein n=1 Tax=Acrobeloides nanus TaxID=290746 RepID=A0A914DPJ8_9BILA
MAITVAQPRYPPRGACPRFRPTVTIISASTTILSTTTSYARVVRQPVRESAIDQAPLPISAAAKCCAFPFNTIAKKTPNSPKIPKFSNVPLPPLSSWRDFVEDSEKVRPVVVIYEPRCNGFRAVDASTMVPVSGPDTAERAQALLAFSRSFKKIKRTCSVGRRKRRRKRPRLLRQWGSAPQLNSTTTKLLMVRGEGLKRKRSHSLIPYTDEEKRRLQKPNKKELLQRYKKVELRLLYRNKFQSTLLDVDSGDRANAFYKSIDAMPNMNVLSTKKSIPLVSELVSQ